MTHIQARLHAWTTRCRQSVQESKLPTTLFGAERAGLLDALATTGFRAVLFERDRLVLGYSGGLMSMAMQLQAWQRILVPSLGGMLAGAPADRAVT